MNTDKNVEFCPFMGKGFSCSENCALYCLSLSDEGACAFAWLASKAIKEMENVDE